MGDSISMFFLVLLIVFVFWFLFNDDNNDVDFVDVVDDDDDDLVTYQPNQTRKKSNHLGNIDNNNKKFGNRQNQICNGTATTTKLIHCLDMYGEYNNFLTAIKYLFDFSSERINNNNH